ncbi:MerR family transcriptional regulator [Kitasatospora sp. NPDC085879]|uniref:MerR family transcriptional regulator n=1 Tax=Kitasatospora sp. NPDC085879 TaxID=3154769 RepID=UPI0034170582
MRIGEAARRAGVSAKAVRRYEALGLISPGRAANGYRSFDEADVRAIREVRALRELGIAADRSRTFLDCLAAGAEASDDCPSSLAAYKSAIDRLTRQIDELASRRTELVGRLREAAYRNSTLRHQDAPAALGPAGLPEDAGTAEHLQGLRLPRLSLACTDGTAVDLGALGPGRSVVYLYPLTGRPDVDLPAGWESIPGARGCTAEACGFRDHHQELVAAGAARVFGLSSQDTGYQREVVERLRLPFAMLSDPGLELASALGLPTFTPAGWSTLHRRLTLVVRDGVVEHVFHPVPEPGRHAEEVLRWLATTP